MAVNYSFFFMCEMYCGGKRAHGVDRRHILLKAQHKLANLLSKCN